MRFIFYILLCLLYISPVCHAAPYEIKINIPSRKLELYKEGQFIKEYPVGVGQAKNKSYHTPIGTYTVNKKVINPIWEHPYKPVGSVRIQSSSTNPLGKYWIGFHNYNGGAYGIHGTNEPASVGKFVSHGCVRMRNADIAELFDMVHEDTTVYVTYQRYGFVTEGDRIYLEIYPDPYAKGAPSMQAILADIYSEIDKEHVYIYRDEIQKAAKDNGYSGLLYNIGVLMPDEEEPAIPQETIPMPAINVMPVGGYYWQ